MKKYTLILLLFVNCFKPEFVKEKVQSLAEQEIAKSEDFSYIIMEDGSISQKEEGSDKFNYKISSFRKGTANFSLLFSENKYKKVRKGWELCEQDECLAAVLTQIVFPPVFLKTVYNLVVGVIENNETSVIKEVEVKKNLNEDKVVLTPEKISKDLLKKPLFTCYVYYSSQKVREIVERRDHNADKVTMKFEEGDFFLGSNDVIVSNQKDKKKELIGEFECNILTGDKDIGKVKNSSMLLIPKNYFPLYNTKLSDFILKNKDGVQLEFRKKDEWEDDFDYKKENSLLFSDFQKKQMNNKLSVSFKNYFKFPPVDLLSYYQQKNINSDFLNFNLSIENLKKMDYQQYVSSGTSTNSDNSRFTKDFCFKWADNALASATPRNENDLDRACSNQWSVGTDDHKKCVQTWRQCRKFY